MQRTPCSSILPRQRPRRCSSEGELSRAPVEMGGARPSARQLSHQLQPPRLLLYQRHRCARGNFTFPQEAYPRAERLLISLLVADSVEKVESRSLRKIRLNDAAIFDLIRLPPQIDYGRLGLTLTGAMRSLTSLPKGGAYGV